MSLLQVRALVSKHVWNRSRELIKRVVDFRPGRFRMSGLVMSSDKQFMYSPYVTADGSYYCDCKGYEATDAICSHILAIMRKAMMLQFDISLWINGLNGRYNESDFMKVYETSVEGYNNMFGGLQAGRYISGIVAPPEVGKSYLAATFAVDMVLDHKKNALIIDTEGGFTPEWIDAILKDRGQEGAINVEFVKWRVKVGQNALMTEPTYENTARTEIEYKASIGQFHNYMKKIDADKPTIFVYDARHLVQIMPFFGRPLKFKVKGGVIEPMDTGDLMPIWECPVGLLVELYNIGYVCLDSLSAPVESFFTGGQINYRTRAKATQALLGRAQDLVDENEIVFMITAHASVGHANPYGEPKIVGGKSVLHNTKYVLIMEKYGGKAVAKKAGVNWRNLRKGRIFRHPLKTPFDEECSLQTTAAGVKDFDRGAYVK